MDLFTLSAILELDTSNFDSGVAAATGKGELLGDSLGKSITKGVAWGNMLSGLAQKTGNLLLDLGSDAIQSAADVEAENAQFSAAFGDMADAAHAAFVQIGDDTNIFNTRLRNVGTQAFSQFKGAGMDATTAMQAMDKYTRLAADAAAYYDISLEDADAKLRSFLRGNTEAGDSIGLFTSEAQRNAYALEKYNMEWSKLNETQRQLLMLDVVGSIYEQSGALGQASREGSSWSNVMGNLKEIWRQTLAVVGKPLMEALIPRIEAFGKWLADNQDTVARFAEVIGKLADIALDGLIAALEWIVENGDDLVGFLSGIFGFMGGGRSPAVAGQFGGLDEYNAAKEWWAAVQQNERTPNQDNYQAQMVAWENLGSVMGTDAAQTFSTALWEHIGNNKLEIEEVEIPAEWFDTTQADLQSDLDGMGLTATVTVTPKYDLSGVGAAFSGIGSFVGGLLGGEDGSHATGLDYVPFNDYRARLHEGEAVLTKLEATEWRRGGGMTLDSSALAAAVAAAVREGMQGMAVRMDGHAVGDVVTRTVSRNLAREAYEGRYST